MVSALQISLFPFQFLDTMIQRELVQKAAFLRDLPAMCAQFDARVLRYKVRVQPGVLSMFSAMQACGPAI